MTTTAIAQLAVTNHDNGVPFTVVFVPAGVAGPNPHRHPASSTHATVEFYDARYPHTAYGQFTGGYYYVETILGTDSYGQGYGGLCLDGGNAASWTVDGYTMDDIVRPWLREQLAVETDVNTDDACDACGAERDELCAPDCIGRAASLDEPYLPAVSTDACTRRGIHDAHLDVMRELASCELDGYRVALYRDPNTGDMRLDMTNPAGGDRYYEVYGDGSLEEL